MRAYPSFARGVLIAAAITLIGTLAASFNAGHLGLGLMTLAYLCHLLYHSPRTTGRVVLLAGWLAGSIAFFVLDASTAIHLAFNIASLWLARSWCHLDTVLQALTDLAWWLLSVMIAIAVILHSASYALGIWSFFLVQALWPWVAQKSAAWTLPEPKVHPQQQPRSASAFDEAKRHAESALNRLQSQSSQHS